MNPREPAVNCTRQSRGNTADITIFRNNQAFHQSARAKRDGEKRLPDNGPLGTDYHDEWTVLADKGYQGLADHVRYIPQKKVATLLVKSNVKRTHLERPSDHGKLLQPMCGLWRICSEKFHWSE